MLVFILVILFLLIAFINFVFGVQSNSDRAKPLALWKVYLVFIGGGIWGMHSFYLRRYFWGCLTFILSITLIIVNFSILKVYWNSPFLLFSIPEYSYLSQSLFYMLIVLLICDLIGMPYYVYRYNNIYYRRHFETDAILGGEELEVEKFYNELSKYIKELDPFMKDVKEILSDECIIEDESKDTSFLGGVKRFGKNVITGGKSSKLEKKMDRLRCLSASCSDLKENLKILADFNKRLSDYLETARITSYRNLFLAKELIFIGKKKVEGKKQVVLVDKSHEIAEVMDLKVDKVKDVNYQSDLFFSNMGLSLSNSLDKLNKSIEIKGGVSKGDLTDVAIDFAVDALFHSIEQIIDVNKEMKEALIKAEYGINSAIKYIDQSIHAILIYKASLLRQSEILEALVVCNKAFIAAYEPLREKIFGEPSLSRYIFKNKAEEDFIQSIQFKEDIKHLMILCSEYNKINQSKVIE